MRRAVSAILLVVTMALVSGCVVYPARPYAAAYWVPGHYGPYGRWFPGHWR